MDGFSPTMQAALDMLDEHGVLERRAGGFWTYPSCPSHLSGPDTVPDWYVGTNTIHALIERGAVVVTRRAGKAQFAVEIARQALTTRDPDTGEGR